MDCDYLYMKHFKKALHRDKQMEPVYLKSLDCLP